MRHMYLELGTRLMFVCVIGNLKLGLCMFVVCNMNLICFYVTYQGAKKKDLTPIKLSLSSELDIHMSTQDYLESCIEDLSQDTYVKGFDPSQKMEIPQLDDRETDLADKKEPAAELIFVSPENFEKMQDWQKLRT